MIECVIASCPEAEVHWYRNGVPIKDSPTVKTIRHGDSCKLVLKDVKADMAGEFRVRAFNELGDTQSTCQVWVEPDASAVAAKQARITSGVEGTAAEEGLKVVLQCSFEADQPKVTWKHDGRPIMPRHDVRVEVSNSKTSLVFSKVTTIEIC